MAARIAERRQMATMMEMWRQRAPMWQWDVALDNWAKIRWLRAVQEDDLLSEIEEHLSGIPDGRGCCAATQAPKAEAPTRQS